MHVLQQHIKSTFHTNWKLDYQILEVANNRKTHTNLLPHT